MLIVIGADVGAARGKPSRDADSPFNPLFPPDLASSNQKLIDTFANKIGDGSPRRGRGVPKSLELAICLDLGSIHAIMLSYLASYRLEYEPRRNSSNLTSRLDKLNQ